MRSIVAVMIMLSVAACSTKNDVVMNADYQKSKSQAEQKRMEAIAEIAKQGEGGVVAAALLLQQNGRYQSEAPKTNGDRVVELAKVVAPSVVGLGHVATNVYSSKNSKEVALKQSDNNLALGVDSNEMVEKLAEVTIVNPETVVNTPTVVCVSDNTYTCE